LASNVALLIVLVLAAVGTAMTGRLLRAVIGLAVASAVVSIVLFHLHATMAAVFELSVGAGLIPAVFLSAIGATQRLTSEAMSERRREILQLYWSLPVIVALAALALTQVRLVGLPTVPAAAPTGDVRTVVWNLRHMDLMGQILALLAAALSVVVLIKELEHEQ
jgi:uncharacterized MnhB-related membrane protein